MSGFRSLNNSTSKRVLNLLEPVKLTVWKVMIERVTVVKFRVNYGGGCDIRSESCFLPTPPAFDAPVRGYCWNIAVLFDTEKLERCCY